MLMLLKGCLVVLEGFGSTMTVLQNELVVRNQNESFVRLVWDASALICVSSLVRCQPGLFIPWGRRQAKLRRVLLMLVSG